MPSILIVDQIQSNAASLKLSTLTTNGVVKTSGGDGTLSAGTIGTTNIDDSAVTTAKITDANITTAKLADSSVTSAKFGITPSTSGNLLKSDGSSWVSAALALSQLPSGRFTVINGTRDLSLAGSTVDYAHGGSGTPVAIFLFGLDDNGAISMGFFDGSTNRSTIRSSTAGATTGQANNALKYLGVPGAQVYIVAGGITFSSTNVTLEWGRSGSPTGTGYFTIVVLF